MQTIKVRDLQPSTRELILNELSLFAAGLKDEVHQSVMSKTLFKKLKPLKNDPLLRKVALEKFLTTETSCRETNRRIASCLRGNKSYADGGVIHTAARKIQEILGPFSIPDMLNLSRFGKGATFRCRGEDVSRARKFSLTDVTPEFNKMARGLLAEYPLWAASLSEASEFAPTCPLLDVVPGGRYSTVPKDSSTDRSIIIEPTINSWFQQGIGRSIRKRLLYKTGVDLDDQSINQNLACIGSLSNDLATVDLSNASDLISTELVKDLLPDDWFFWLNLTRSRRVLIDGSWVELEKFSSMGNGFTFDLESLIFYALSWALVVSEGFNPFWVNVFGDDIVIPSGVKVPFLKLFDDVGFQVNVAKSFFDGPFRESCGHDYHRGVNVRGVYVKDLRTDIDVMKVHNRMYEWANRHSIRWDGLRGFLLTHLSHLKARVPPELGDVGVFSSFEEALPIASRDGWFAVGYIGMLPVLRTKERSDRYLLLDRLQGSDFQRNKCAVRQDIIAYRLARIWVFPD